jgi:cyclic-di-GMP-binding protein
MKPAEEGMFIINVRRSALILSQELTAKDQERQFRFSLRSRRPLRLNAFERIKAQTTLIYNVMPENTFDIVSKIDLQEVSNAIQQALKEIHTRFDLKDSKSDITLDPKEGMVLTSLDEYKLKAVNDVLQQKLVKRGVPLKGLTYSAVEPAAGSTVRQKITMQQGIPIEKARDIVKLIKNSKKKVQASIQGDLVRVSGKDRDTLQEIIALLRQQDFGIDMQFTNYRTN